MKPTCHPQTSFVKDQKIRLCLDHSGKERTNPVYGYIVALNTSETESKYEVFTEEGMKAGEECYLIQTSWSGGAVWYTRRALMPTGGKNELNAWKDKMAKYHAAEARKAACHC
jgi:hypothetical protein